MREPIAILLKDEFWITVKEEDIGDVQMLFVYGGEGHFIPIHCITDEKMPDNIQGDWFERQLFVFVLGVLVNVIVWV